MTESHQGEKPTVPASAARGSEPAPAAQGAGRDLHAELGQILGDEELRLRFRAWLDPPRQSPWSRLAAHPLLTLVVGFLLTGVLGTWLANYYAVRNELSKTRAAKIAEVWEKLSLHEAAASRTLDDWLKFALYMPPALAAGDPTAADEDPEHQKLADRAAKSLNQLNELAVEARDIADRNRIWIGEGMYARVHSYLAETSDLVKTGGLRSGASIEERRRQVRATFTEIREMVFEDQ